MTRLADHDFENGTLTKTGWTVVGSPAWQNTVAAHGSAGMLITPSGSQELINTAKNSVTGTNDNFARFYFRMSAAPSANFYIFSTFNTVSCYLRLTTGRRLAVMSNTTVKATGAALNVDQWYCIEVRTRCGSSSGNGEWEVRVDGASYLTTQTGMAMGTAAYGHYFGCIASATSSGNFYFDDLAVNSNAGAAPDNTWIGPIAADPPDAPVLSGEAGDGQVSLEWTTVSGAVGYTVYRDTVNVHETTDTEWVDTGVTNGVEYDYYVTTYDGSLESDPSNIVTLTPEVPATPPSASVVEDFDRSDQNPIAGNWTSNGSGLGATRIVSNTLAAASDSGEASYDVPMDGTAKVEMGVTLSTANDFYVGVTDAQNRLQGYIGGHDGLYRFDDDTPTQLVSLTVTPADGDQYWITYNPSDGLVEFWRYRSSTWTRLASATDTTYDDVTSWYSWLAPWDSATRMDNFAQMESGVAGPTGLTVVEEGHNHVKLSWDAVDGATGYTIYQDPNNGAPAEEAGGIISGTTADIFAINGKEFTYTVTATVSGDETAPSDPVNATAVFPTYTEKVRIPLAGPDKVAGLTRETIATDIGTVKADITLPSWSDEVLEYNPVVFWRLRETSAVAVDDAGPNGIDATATSITYSPSWSPLNDGGASYYFSGSSKVSASLDLSDKDRILVGAWYDLADLQDDEVLFAHGSESATSGLAFGVIRDGDDIGVYVGNNTSDFGYFSFDASTVIGDDDWHLVVVEIGTRDQFVNLWIDGARVMHNEGNVRDWAWGTFQNATFNIGADGAGTAALHSDVAEFFIIDRWLTPREHKRLFANGRAEEDVALKAVVYLDNGEGEPEDFAGISNEVVVAAGSREVETTFTFSTPITAPGDCWVGFIGADSKANYAFVEGSSSDLTDGKSAQADYDTGALTLDQDVIWGAWTHYMDYDTGTPDPGDSSPQDMNIQATMESHAGKTASVINTGIYLPVEPGSQSDAWFDVNAEKIIRHGSLYMCSASTGGIDQQDIVDGLYDDAILLVADAMRVFGWPILLRFNWEMNGDWFSWAAGYSGMDAATYIAVWQHVHGLFQTAGAYNVQFGWCPNGEWTTSPLAVEMEDCYPGDAYVDWVGQDSYQWGNIGWDSVLHETLDRLSTLAPNKPQFVGETAVSVNDTNKAASLASLFDELGTASDPNWLYKIRMIAFFQSLEPGSAVDNQWPFEKGTGAQTAFQTGIGDSRFLAANSGNQMQWPVMPWSSSTGPESTGMAATITTAPPLATGYNGFTSAGGIFPDETWVPFSSESPWNLGDVATRTKHPNSDEYVEALMAAADITASFENGSATDAPYDVTRIAMNWPDHDVFHPIYWATDDDPEYTLTRSPGGAGDGIHGTTIKAPQGLLPGDGVDTHLTVIRPDGTGIDFWQTTVDNTGHTITYQIAKTFDVEGDGTGGGGTAAGFPSIAGQVTPAELEAGEINHALFITVIVGADENDTSFGYGTVAGDDDGSHVYPANSGDSQASEGSPWTDGYEFPPMGAWIRVNLTESEVNALSIPTWKKAILHALRVYGGFFGDTGGAGFGVWQFQSSQMFTSMGFDDPYVDYADAHATGEDISNESGVRVFDPNDGIDWANILEVVLPPNVTGTIQEGEATIAGTSSVTAAALVERSGSATIAATSSDTASASVDRNATATVNATSSVTAAASVTREGTASSAGVSSVTAAATVERYGSATIAAVSAVEVEAATALSGVAESDGVSTVSATASRVLASVESTITATSTTSAEGSLLQSGEATIVGASTVTASANVDRLAEASSAAISTVTATASVERYGSATIASTTDIDADGVVHYSASSTIAGISGVTASAGVIIPAEATIAAVSAVDAEANVELSGESTIEATSSVEARAGVAGESAEVTVSGTSSVSVSASIIASGSATIAAHSDASATGQRLVMGQTSSAGVSGAEAEANAVYSATAQSDGVSGVTVTAGTTSFVFGEALIEAVSDAQVNGNVVAAGEATIAGQSSISASATIIRTGKVTIDASSSITAGATLYVGGQATIAATTTVIGTPSIIISGSALISAQSGVIVAGSDTVVTIDFVVYVHDNEYRVYPPREAERKVVATSRAQGMIISDSEIKVSGDYLKTQSTATRLTLPDEDLTLYAD